MMFPDTNNDQQLAAIRRAAERFRAAGNSNPEHTTLKPFAATQERFNSGDTNEPMLCVADQEELCLASR